MTAPAYTPVAIGPRSLDIARLLLQSASTTVIGLFNELTTARPGLSFDDFRSGWALYDMLLRAPERIKVVGEGLPSPREDPEGWLSELIALLYAPSRGRA